jgi:biotin carboxylase
VFATTTGYQIRAFGDAARKLGVALSFASDRCDQLDDPWWDQAIPVRFHDEAAALNAVLQACANHPPDAVLAVGDRPTVLAATVAQALGRSFHPPQAAAASRNKLVTRALLRDAGLRTPWFTTLSLAGDPRARAATLPYPVVLKPLALSGSRGVVRVDTCDELVAAFSRVKSILESPDVRRERDRAHEIALVETFVPGREYAVEGLLVHGRFHPLAIFDKPDPLDGPFFEETIYVTPSRATPSLQTRIIERVAAAARALGLTHGPVHAECRVSPDEGTGAGQDDVIVLEVAARPIGGLCARALRFEAGGDVWSLEELLLRHALGDEVTAARREPEASGVMMIPIPRRGVLRRVEGISRAQRVRGIHEIQITAKPDALLVPLPEGRSYLGFIFARCPTPDAAEQALREAHARLEFQIDREVAMIGRS